MPGLAAGMVLGVLVALGSRRIGLLGLGLVFMTAIATVVEGPLDVGSIRLFSIERPTAHVLGLLTGLTWIAAGVAAWLQSRPTAAAASEEDRWDRQRLTPILLLALVAGAVTAARLLVA